MRRVDSGVVMHGITGCCGVLMLQLREDEDGEAWTACLSVGSWLMPKVNKQIITSNFLLQKKIREGVRNRSLRRRAQSSCGGEGVTDKTQETTELCKMAAKPKAGISDGVQRHTGYPINDTATPISTILPTLQIPNRDSLAFLSRIPQRQLWR